MLKDLIQVGTGSNYQSKKYVGCGQVITRIIYHAVGMTDSLIEVPDEEHAFWEEVGERREATQRETRGKKKMMEEEMSSDEEEEQEPPAGVSRCPYTCSCPAKIEE